MKTLKFDKVEKMEFIPPFPKNSNGIFDLLCFGYNFHLPITISPDDVLNSLSILWSKYIISNSEKFRGQFVIHKGRVDLVYETGGAWSESRSDEFMMGLISLIKENQENDKFEWMQYSFSTTKDLDLFIRQSSILSSQKEYYVYHGSMLCGFPEITLEGSSEDWETLIECVKRMYCPDQEMKEWKERLINKVLIKFAEAENDEDFWQSAIMKKPYGSGGQYRASGWATEFNPFNEKGRWLGTGKVDGSDVLNMSCSFIMNLNDNGKEFKILFTSGQDELVIDGERLRVKKRFSANEVNRP